MLLITENVVRFCIVHYNYCANQYMLKDLTRHTGEGDGPVVGGIIVLAFLENGGNMGGTPILGFTKTSL